MLQMSPFCKNAVLSRCNLTRENIAETKKDEISKHETAFSEHPSFWKEAISSENIWNSAHIFDVSKVRVHLIRCLFLRNVRQIKARHVAVNSTGVWSASSYINPLFLAARDAQPCILLQGICRGRSEGGKVAAILRGQKNWWAQKSPNKVASTFFNTVH